MARQARETSWDILGIGGAHVDRVGQVSGEHRPGASNPGRLRSTVGGGVLNALRAARLRGAGDIAIISARGGDADGLAVEGAIAESRIADMSAVFLDRQTASYTAILDRTGELITGVADMDIYESALPRQLRRRALRDPIGRARCILVDANLPEAALAAIAGMHPGPVFAMAVSPVKAVRLLAIAKRVDAVFMNRRELHALTQEAHCPDAFDELRARGFRRAVISNGGGPVTILNDGRLSEAGVPTGGTVRDVTGAGDALCGATVAGLLNNAEAVLADAVRDGIAAACLTVEAQGPVADQLSGPGFEALRRRVSVSDAIALRERI